MYFIISMFDTDPLAPGVSLTRPPGVAGQMEARINESGYHRRDEELADATRAIRNR
jgi:hypothetical protein